MYPWKYLQRGPDQVLAHERQVSMQLSFSLHASSLCQRFAGFRESWSISIQRFLQQQSSRRPLQTLMLSLSCGRKPCPTLTGLYQAPLRTCPTKAKAMMKKTMRMISPATKRLVQGCTPFLRVSSMSIARTMHARQTGHLGDIWVTSAAIFWSTVEFQDPQTHNCHRFVLCMLEPSRCSVCFLPEPLPYIIARLAWLLLPCHQAV